MPTYSYKCGSCGNEFDLFQKITDPPAEKCPNCGGPIKRQIGPGAGIIFKGSGFYATDYRSPDYMRRAKTESGGSSESSSSSSASPPSEGRSKKD